MNCRKMYEFFVYPPPRNATYFDMRARQFTKLEVMYRFNYWTSDVQEYMHKQLMHVVYDRTVRTNVLHTNNQRFLNDFQFAWKLFIENVTDATEFLEEIAEKEKTEFGCFNLRVSDVWDGRMPRKVRR
jgi:hypothetical protein